MTALTATATLSTAPALTPEQQAALALLADPGTTEPQPRYVLPRHVARDAHRRIAKALVAAGRADLLDSRPMCNLHTVATAPEALRLHPADQRAVTAAAGAFDLGSLAMTMTLAALLHHSKAKHRTRRDAAARS